MKRLPVVKKPRGVFGISRLAVRSISQGSCLWVRTDIARSVLLAASMAR